MLKIAICDDEQYILNIMKEWIEKYLQRAGIAFQVSNFLSGEEFLELGLEILNYQIIFLDINMDKLDGMKTAQRIRELGSEMFVVFATANINCTLEGYKVGAIRYLLKDKNFESSIYECIDAILFRMKYIVGMVDFKFGTEIKTVAVNKILYIESKAHKLEFHIMEEQLKIYDMYGKLDEIENKLKQYHFLRVHQSYLVNLKHITMIKNNEVRLTDGQVVIIPRARRKEVFALYAKSKGEF